MKLISNKNGRLPITRKEQVWFLLKGEIGILFLSNFLTFLTLIPLLLVFFFGVSTFHQYNLDTSKNNIDFFNIFLMYGLLLIPAILLFSIGLSGLFSVVKKLTFESTCKIKEYFIGIFKNYRHCFFFYLLLSIISGLFVINFGYTFYLEGDPTFKCILFGVNALLLLSVIIASPIASFEMMTFKNYTVSYIRNGLYLFYKCFPLTLINLLLVVLPIVLVCFIPIKVFFIPLGMFATFYLSLSSLIIYILSLYIFEKVVPSKDIEDI